MTTDWNADLGLSEYTVTIAGWPRRIPVSAKSEQSAINKARMASAATTGDRKWITAEASAVRAD